MAHDEGSARRHDRWAHVRFAVVGALLASPPKKGDLHAALTTLAQREWQHPTRGESVRFARSTIERWYYQARHAPVDPVGRLRRRVRRDAGAQPSMTEALRQALHVQYAAHRSWSYQLHRDNLRALVAATPALGSLPSYSSVRRYMQAQGLLRQRRRTARDRPGADRVELARQPREVRSYEVEYVGGLWHADFHYGSLKVLTSSGAWVTPRLLAFLDDHSRLCCHAQWYLAETTETFVHGLCQAIQKRGLPRAILTDNGAPMTAAETREGLVRLGVTGTTTLPYSPFQNAKQEILWAQVEGRLLAMLEGVAADLRLDLLNEATQAWFDLEYHRKSHAETGQTPLARFLAGPEVLRPSPSAEALRVAFTTEQIRSQRRSDGTISVEGVRFEVPARFAHLARLAIRYARWDLSSVLLCDRRTGAVLGKLYPLDKTRNADAVRRVVAVTPSTQPVPAATGVAPLLDSLLRQYRASGLPPAYLPTTDSTLEKD
ncbi:MAG: DDE-type integrase/transposase/recombinase, partial [Candidatus Latescibacteria bacterium]|nr:DDE-type integrase/transposase/recombinase [Candidatus Latescibacterota bacterium]